VGAVEPRADVAQQLRRKDGVVAAARRAHFSDPIFVGAAGPEMLLELRD
jgi:hypothetical protein